MNRLRRIFVIAVFAPLTVSVVHSQSGTYLQGLYIGSQGETGKETPGAEESLQSFHDEFLQSMGLRSRSNTVLALSSLGEQSAFDRIATMQGLSDSNDVAVAVALGGWQKDPRQPELAMLSAAHPDRLTLDYFLNLILFLPVKTMAVFMLAPSQKPFPVDFFQRQRPGIGGGGKYLVVLQPKKDVDFESAIDAFHDLLDKTGEGAPGDRNKDGILTFTEWMTFFERLAAEEFTVLSYRITEAPDIQLRQLH